MGKEILHIWGPFSIQSYGLFIALGIVLAIWLFMRDSRRASILSSDQFGKIISITIFAAIIGGRLLYVLEENSAIKSFWDIFKVWEGGLSSLGSIAGILLVIPIYLRSMGIPIVRFLDLTAIYAPIVEAMARFGCFFAGCCYGIETTLPWGVTYTDPSCAAPLYKSLHPTQLYCSLAAFVIFLLMKFLFSKLLQKPGQLLCVYLMLTSIARGSIDFIRGDRTFFSQQGVLSILSSSQIISLCLCTLSFVTLIAIQLFYNKQKQSI